MLEMNQFTSMYKLVVREKSSQRSETDLQTTQRERERNIIREKISEKGKS